MESFARPRKHPTDGFEDPSRAHLGWRPSRGAYSSRGYIRGGRAQIHRNRTLVLNGSNATPTNTAIATPDAENSENVAGHATTTQGWVTKTDRHLQLINTSIFEKESQNRAKAMEETRKQKLRQRDEREKARLSKHLQRLAGNIDHVSGVQPRPADLPGNYEIMVQGIRFRVTKNGSKLVKVPGESPQPTRPCREACLCVYELRSPCTGDLNAAKSTPKTAVVGGVRFYRSKNGNLFRSGIIKAHRYGRPSIKFDMGIAIHSQYNADFSNARRTGVVKKINEPCRIFSTTGTFFLFKAFEFP